MASSTVMEPFSMFRFIKTLRPLSGFLCLIAAVYAFRHGEPVPERPVMITP